MPVPETPLPSPLTGEALVVARDQVVEVVEAWGAAHWESETIGHAGKVTLEYLRRDGYRAPRAVVTVVRGKNARLSGGKTTEFLATFQLFLVVDGAIDDRTTLGLALAGAAVRLVTASPWLEIDDSAFSRTPIAESVRMTALYDDKDERDGMSVWGVTWDQAIDLGTARRPATPGPEHLALIQGTATIPGEPNNATVETEVA